MLAKLFLLVAVAIVATQSQDGAKGPTIPINGLTSRDCKGPGYKFGDENNMCWYHECVQTSISTYKVIKRQCGTGSRVRYTFVEGFGGVCEHNFKYTIGYECARERDSKPEPNKRCPFTCKNGGTLHNDNAICWCECPAEFSGDFDCSQRVNRDLLANPDKADNRCVDGWDGIDHCAARGACRNGGTCHNQCGGYWCECVTPYRYGKNCERFSCERHGECYNGGTCDRGNNRDGEETRVCHCPSGFWGYQCQHNATGTYYFVL